MPLFSRHTEPEPEVVPVEPAHAEPKKHGLFSRRSPSPTPSAATNSTRMTSSSYHTSGTGNAGGVFRRSTDASSGRRSLLHRTFGNGNNEVDMDPSIVQARERVMSAEAAEREADRVLDIARREVHAAREHVKRLELEAKEEARRARIKQYHAKEVSKRAKPLGRTLPSSPLFLIKMTRQKEMQTDADFI